MERLTLGKITADIPPQKAVETTIASLSAPGESHKGNPPFVIRGHHLDLLIDIARQYASPEDLASELRNSREDERSMTLTQKKKRTEEQILYVKQEREYARDIIGKTRKEANLYEQKMTEILGDFLELPNDHPVKVVIGQKDEICKTCTVGEHCLFKDQGKYNAGESVSADGFYVNIFRYVAQKNNLEADLRIEEEIATFIDAEPERVMAIFTSARVVKKVLEDRSFRRIAANKQRKGLQ